LEKLWRDEKEMPPGEVEVDCGEVRGWSQEPGWAYRGVDGPPLASVGGVPGKLLKRHYRIRANGP